MLTVSIVHKAAVAAIPGGVRRFSLNSVFPEQFDAAVAAIPGGVRRRFTILELLQSVLPQSPRFRGA